MPTTARPENHIIRLFVWAYEKGSWKDSVLTFPDEVKDGGIDGLAERMDGATLAIEHTVVEPFVGDIADQAEMLPMSHCRHQLRVMLPRDHFLIFSR